MKQLTEDYFKVFYSGNFILKFNHIWRLMKFKKEKKTVSLRNDYNITAICFNHFV